MRVPAPVLLGERLAPTARAIVDDIARALQRVDPPTDGDLDVITSLLTREPGLTIFYANLARVQPRAQWRRVGVRHLERAIARVPNMSYKPFFSYGFSGTAWAIVRALDSGDEARCANALAIQYHLYGRSEGPRLSDGGRAAIARAVAALRSRPALPQRVRDQLAEYAPPENPI